MYLFQVFIGRISNIGQVFESHEETYTFYNIYARETSFNTRITKNKKNKETGKTIWKLFVCFKKGKIDETYQMDRKNVVSRVVKRNCGYTQVGCNARLSVVKQQTGNNWVVRQFVDKHNHGRTMPSRVHLLRSYRNVLATKKTLTQQFLKANIPTCQQL